MRLKITIDGKGNLDLYDNTRIPVKLRNPMFHDVGSHSFSFDIPWTHNNTNLLAKTQRVSRAKSSLTIHRFTAYFSGVMLFRGTLKSPYSTDGKFNIYFEIQEASIYSAIHNTTINKLDSTLYTLDHSGCKAAEYSDSDFRMGMINNPPPGAGINNVYNVPTADSKYIYPTDNTPEPYSYEYPIPFFKGIFILKKIAALMGYTVNAPLFDRYPELYEMVVNTLTSYNNHPQAINYMDGIPEYKAKAFMKDLKNLFNLFFRVDEYKKEFIIENVDYILTDKNIVQANNMFIKKVKREEYAGVALRQKKDENDTLSEELSYISLYGDKKIDTSMGPIPMLNKGISINSIEFNIDSSDAPSGSVPPFTFSPTMDVKIPNFNVEYADSKKINPRILFHRGFQSVLNYNISTIRDSTGAVFTLSSFVSWAQFYMSGFNKYPYLTQGVEDITGTKMPAANISLEWEGQYGLLENFWNKTLLWQEQTKVPVDGVAYFDEQQLATFDILAKYIIQDTKFIVSKMDFNLEANSISPIKFSAFRV